MRHVRRGLLLSGLLYLAFLSTSLRADSGTPLTLKEALATADAPYPEIMAAQAGRAAARADVDLAVARRGLSVTLDGRLGSGRPSAGDGDFSADNGVTLVARKTLYDFGRSAAAQQAAQFEVKAREAALMDTRQRRRIEIMGSFFNVLLADLQYAAADEFMAVAYVKYDHARDRLQRGQIARVDLARLRARYQDARVKRSLSDQRRRITRALLANVMNRPGDLPDNLAIPKLPGNNRTLPDYQTLIPVMLAHNPRLRVQRERLAAAQERLEALRAQSNPVLSAEMDAGDYSRTSLTRNRIGAYIVLSWPFYQGGRAQARIAREQARFQQLQAGAARLKMELTQALLETYLEIEQLQHVAREAAKMQAQYRDLALQKARGEYEMEFKTDLGNSMAETVVATLRQRKTEYRLALAFARLEALLGKPPGQEVGHKAAAG